MRNIREWERAAGQKLMRKLDAAGVESSRNGLSAGTVQPLSPVNDCPAAARVRCGRADQVTAR